MAERSKGRITLNLNQTNAEELVRMAGIPKSTAENLIKYCNEHGPIRDWGELTAVPGFDEDIIRKVRNQFTL